MIGEETPNDNFNQMPKIKFSGIGGGNGQQGNNISNGPNTNSNQSSSTTGTGCGAASGSRINNNHQSSGFSNFGSVSMTNESAAAEGTQQQPSHQFSSQQLEIAMDEVEAEVTKQYEVYLQQERIEHQSKIQNQQKEFEKHDAERQLEIEGKNELIYKQQAEMIKFRQEIENMKHVVTSLNEELKYTKDSHTREKDSLLLALENNSCQQRKIQLVNDFQSSMSTTPSKRGRIDHDTKETTALVEDATSSTGNSARSTENISHVEYDSVEMSSSVGDQEVNDDSNNADAAFASLSDIDDFLTEFDRNKGSDKNGNAESSMNVEKKEAKQIHLYSPVTVSN